MSRPTKMMPGVRASSVAARGGEGAPSKGDLIALIEALKVVARPDLHVDASPDEWNAFNRDKAVALDKLCAYFDAQLEAENKGPTMASARAGVRALTARVAQAEKASAAATARSKRIQGGRAAYGDLADPVAFAIDEAVGRSRSNDRGRAGTTRTPAPVPSDPVVAWIEQAQRNSLASQRRGK